MGALHRFRVATEESPLLAQVSEYMMDLYAYRDDAHISTWKSYGVQGLAWNAFTSLWRGDATSPAQITEQAAFRGYTAADYEKAIQELVRRGWLEESETPGIYRATKLGQSLREAVEQLTDDYFYAPWSSLNESEIVELRGLLSCLAERLQALPAEQQA
jgi:DNA-binding MarR family transcriptional regulator